MNINDGSLKTSIDGKFFFICTEEEGDFSCDGGYTFETVKSVHGLDASQAKTLKNELEDFILMKEWERANHDTN